MVCALKSISIFFNYSPKRQREFEKSIVAIEERGTAKMKKAGTRLRNWMMQTTVILMMKNKWMTKKMTVKKCHS